MNRFLKTFFRSRVWLGLVSILLALLLFFAAMLSDYSQSSTQLSSAIETYTHTLMDIPIDIKYDADKYFISGYSNITEVYLTSVNRVKLDSEINSDTRNFKVVADLSGLDPGTHTVDLKVSNISSGVKATVLPQRISVTIGKKKTKTFDVKGQVASGQIATGYELKNISTDVSDVQVTSDESIVNQIDHVVASLPESEILSESYSNQVALQAVSADGTILASVISPAKTKLDVTVKKLTKSVPITLKTTGEMSDEISNISYKLSKDNVTISGSQAALDAIDAINTEVDISNITKNTVKTLNLSANNVSLTPSIVTVKLTVTKK